MAGLGGAPLHTMECLRDGFLGLGLSYASAALFVYDYTLTFSDELRLVLSHKWTGSTFVFCVARYAGMASALVTLIQTPARSVVFANMGTALRIAVIVASESILALRTWAIWERKRSILILLIVLSLAAVGGISSVLWQGIRSTQVQSSVCSEITNSRSTAYLIPYLVVIGFEIVTMSLSGFKIMKWRKGIRRGNLNRKLLDTLWNDGVLYFSWLIILGFVNVMLIVFHSASAVRTGGAQLQTSIHSILASRIVLHLASIPRNRARGDSESHDTDTYPLSNLLTTPQLSYGHDSSYIDAYGVSSSWTK